MLLKTQFPLPRRFETHRTNPDAALTRRLPDRFDIASGLGLLVAEFVKNSLKYSYRVGERGNVNVDFKPTTNGWRLEVSDE